MQHKILTIIEEGSKPLAHTVNTPKYLKKTVTETAWTQPILTSNGTLGGNSFAVSGVTYQTSRDLWNMFDNNLSTFYDPSVMGGSFYNVIFTIYNPKPICVTQVKYVVSGGYYQSKVQVQGSNDNSTWTNLGTYNLASGSTQTANITNTQFFNYYKFTGEGYSMVPEVKLTATEKTTSSNYDMIIPQKHTVNTPKYLKKTVTETAWTQPILTSNGTIGGDAFAVGGTPPTGGSTWILFNGNTNNTEQYVQYTTVGSYIIIYNPTPLNITALNWLVFRNDLQYFPRNCTAYGSSDNNSWNTLGTFNNVLSWSLSSNTTYYKYHKVVINTLASSYIDIRQCNITATEQTEAWQAGTPNDYDLIK